MDSDIMTNIEDLPATPWWMEDPDVTKAWAMAKAAHAGAKRKYNNRPYITHPLTVASMVSEAGGSSDMVSAALLHDVIEDTSITKEEIAYHLNQTIAGLVDALTNRSKPEDGNRSQRKRIDREHLWRASPDAQTIKYCDIIDNTRYIVQDDPKFAKTYLQEKWLLLRGLDKGWDRLHRQAMDSVVDGLIELVNR